MTGKTFLVGFVMFLLGGGTGYFIAQKTLEQKYADLAQEEIDSVYDEVDERMERIKEMWAEKKTKSEINPPEGKRISQNPNVVLTRSSIDTPVANPYEQAKKNYNLFSNQPPEDTDEEDQEEPEPDDDDEELEPPITVDRTQPYRITEEEFNEEFDHHDKLSLYYYTKDDVLCDENEELVDDISRVLGDEIWQIFEERQNPYAMWVRNEPLGADYEIMSISKSYAEEVHGLREDDTHAKEIRARKRRESRDE